MSDLLLHYRFYDCRFQKKPSNFFHDGERSKPGGYDVRTHILKGGGILKTFVNPAPELSPSEREKLSFKPKVFRRGEYYLPR